MSEHILCSKTYLDIATGTETGLNILAVESFDGGTDPSHFGSTSGLVLRKIANLAGPASIHASGYTGQALKGRMIQSFKPLSDDTGYAGHATYVVTFRVRRDSATLRFDGWCLLYFLEMGNLSHQQMVFEFRADGAIYARRGNAAQDNNGTILQQTATGLLVPNTWYRIDARVTIADSPSGAWNLAVDGTQVLNGTGDTYENYPAPTDHELGVVALGGFADALTVIDDVLIADGGGSSTTYPGDLRVYARHPTSNSEVQGTPSTGTNYETVDEVGQNDADYVDYGAGTLAFKPVAKLSGTTAEGSQRTFATAQSVFSEPTAPHVFVTKPTGGAWTSVANVDDTTFGMRKGSTTDLYNFQDLGVAGTPIAVQVTNRVAWMEVADEQGVWGTVRM